MQMSRNVQKQATDKPFQEDLEVEHNFDALKSDLPQSYRVSLTGKNWII